MISNYLKNATEIEQKIVSLLQAKDRSAISLAYKHYGANLYGVVLGILKNEEDAQEVIQDTFVKIWSNSDKYDKTKGKLYTWMINIARRTAIDKTRSAVFKARKRTDSTDATEKYNVTWSTPGKVKDVGLEKVINSIDEKYRTIIDLVYFQGYTMKEVHEELDIPLGTVKSRVRLALKELRKKLSDPENGVHLAILFNIIEFYLKNCNSGY